MTNKTQKTQQTQQTQKYENMEQVKEFHKFIKRCGDSKLYKKVKNYYKNEMQESGEELEESIIIETAEEFKKLSFNDRVNYIFENYQFFKMTFENVFDYFIDYEDFNLGNLCDYDYNKAHKYVVLNQRFTNYLRNNNIKLSIEQAKKISIFIKNAFDYDLNSKYDIDYLFDNLIAL